jgi:hypothetical protein
MGRRPSRDRLTDEEAKLLRLAARHVLKLKGLTQQQLANDLRWELRRVVDTLAKGRPLRAPNAEKLFRALRKARPRRKTRSRSSSQDQATVTNANRIVDAALASLDKRPLPPAALVPRWAVRNVAEYLAYTMSQLQPAVGAKARKLVAEGLERALNGAAPSMTFMFCQLFGDWTESRAVRAAVDGYRKELLAMGFVFEKEKA